MYYYCVYLNIYLNVNYLYQMVILGYKWLTEHSLSIPDSTVINIT